MAPARGPPPANESELFARADALAGRTLGELAQSWAFPPPGPALRAKGWAGALLEHVLGADAGVQARPDFTRLDIELKTLPVGDDGRPLESTYVCTVPLRPEPGLSWESSLPGRKLAHVLFIPIVGERGTPLPDRQVGCPVRWRPAPDEERALRADFAEIMELVVAGELERLDARLGTALQVRPKAADGRALTGATGPGGEPVAALPRGFYLRATFTAALLRRALALPAARP